MHQSDYNFLLFVVLTSHYIDPTFAKIAGLVFFGLFLIHLVLEWREAKRGT